MTVENIIDGALGIVFMILGSAILQIAMISHNIAWYLIAFSCYLIMAKQLKRTVE